MGKEIKLEIMEKKTLYNFPNKTFIRGVGFSHEL
jgi:hypothetical protein